MSLARKEVLASKALDCKDKAEEITTSEKEQKRWPEGITSSNRTPPFAASQVEKGKLALRSEPQSSMYQSGDGLQFFLGIWLMATKLLEPREKEAWLLFQLVADLDIIVVWF